MEMKTRTNQPVTANDGSEPVNAGDVVSIVTNLIDDGETSALLGSPVVSSFVEGEGGTLGGTIGMSFPMGYLPTSILISCGDLGKCEIRMPQWKFILSGNGGYLEPVAPQYSFTGAISSMIDEIEFNDMMLDDDGYSYIDFAITFVNELEDSFIVENDNSPALLQVINLYQYEN